MNKSIKSSHLHFVGIGGIGMSGIAEVLLNQGYTISGSDLTDSDNTKRLAKLGAQVLIGHRAENILGANVVVISSAVKADNPELMEARRLRVPVIRRAEMLGELMRGKTGIAVAGSHGKTTTTSMLATVLTAAGVDPTIVIGGKVDSLGGNAKLGSGRFVVAEADESDGSFLHLPATYAVVTNIDNDHLDHFGSIAEVENAFLELVAKLPFYGRAAVCGEDPGVARCMDRWSKPITTYGLSNQWDIYAQQVELKPLGSQFSVFARRHQQAHLSHELRHENLGRVSLHVPGLHNVLNALATVAIATELEIPFAKIASGLEQFRGVDRRFQIRYRNEVRNQAIVDDYGHHPTEILATLSAARNFWPGRIITVFQPHRYSRTWHCREGFLAAFGNTDVLYMSDIYSAGEEPIAGVDSRSLCASIAKLSRSDQRIEYGGELEKIQEKVLNDFRPGDLILCMGAGSITKLAEKLAHAQV